MVAIWNRKLSARPSFDAVDVPAALQKFVYFWATICRVGGLAIRDAAPGMRRSRELQTSWGEPMRHARVRWLVEKCHRAQVRSGLMRVHWPSPCFVQSPTASASLVP